MAEYGVSNSSGVLVPGAMCESAGRLVIAFVVCWRRGSSAELKVSSLLKEDRPLKTYLLDHLSPIRRKKVTVTSW